LSAYENVRALAPRIMGKDSQNREARWRDLQTYVLPATPGAVAAIDIALWDLAASRAQLPLYQFLGGARDRIETYASTPELDSIADYLKLILNVRADGFRAVKFHAWNVPDRDLEMIRAVHAEYGGSDITFMHDAENRYDRRSALRVARELESLNFRWFEAPFLDYDLAGYRELRNRVQIPIVPHGLWFSELQEFVYALEHNPWDAVRFDTTIVGGITAARKICAVAEAFGVGVEPQSWGYSLIQAPNLHLDLATNQASYFELPVPYEAYEFGVENPFRPDSGGFVTAPSAPGLGLNIDWAAMEGASLATCEYRRALE
jgi:L-alanine-DL-glutamate epimerase-like enolase superfamily enzyme